ncbi:unnamed protein product [Acanthoscelides obtectus]|uniref:TOG domain-containing protein n=2 Tax=Acanthoscelides obtectus TaxID=200917 RepID=A0A9P0K1H0_ACAOB|nr:unnamed protein product [Acanthoscelides obtectus]CAK1639501.1 Protein mini spindles [Acanthoscelides obtectus]
MHSQGLCVALARLIMEEEDFKKLPAEEKCVHKVWKVRVAGYEEVTKLFKQIDDEKSSEFSKYLGLVKKFVVDSNAVGQEKGLEATLAYVENYAHAGKTVSEVMSGIVSKCVAAQKTKTRELALQLILMYIEIEKQEAVQEELIKGMEAKNPKIVSACVNASTVSLREFGSKIVNVKPLLKKISTLLADRDKTVRDETKMMIVEMHRWIGAALKPQLQAANLQAVQMTELDAEFAKIEGQKASPTRYIRSQQAKQAAMAAEEAANGDEGDEEEEHNDEAVAVDPYELADPVDILSKLPKDFFDKIEAKKWQERKEVLEILENLVKTPKLENGDYGDLIRALKKVVQKDTNVICVAIAGRSIAGIASGLKKKFQTYAGFVVPALLEKFKEKKSNVVSALREAIDATYLTTTLDAILDDVLESLNNKNPSVKLESSLFLARAFTKTLATSVNKKLLKAITTALVKNINEPDPSVREASAEAIGTLMKLVGEKAMAPYIIELEKDNLKMAKIKEFCDKAVITVKVPGMKKERAVTAPPKVAAQKSASSSAVPGAGAKKADPKRKTVISSGSATVVRSKGTKPIQKSPSQSIEKELSDEEIDEIISGLLEASVIEDLASINWKTRLAAAEQLQSTIQMWDSKSVPIQAVIRFICRKPGLKDTHFQVLKQKLESVRQLAEMCRFGQTTVDACLVDIAEKCGDAKNGATAMAALTAVAEAAGGLFNVATPVLEYAFQQKSPKVQQELLGWMANAITEFGFGNMNVKQLIEHSKKGLSSSNPGVRQSAISLLGTIYVYVGPTLMVFLENEKAAVKDLINAEIEKHEGEKPPAPIRGVKKSASSNSLDAVEDDEPTEPEPVNIQDLIPRTDISGQITETLLNELADKNWKERCEALGKINTIIQEAKFIKSNLGDLPQALATRLSDSNAKIAQTAINLCDTIAKAMGSPSKQYIKVFFPGLLQAMGDSKSTTRSAALDAVNAFAEQCGYREFFENEMVSDALKSGSPALRVELWNWLAEHLPKVTPRTVPKEEIVSLVPYLYNNLEDRNAEVRKNVQEAILGVMMHLGYESMLKQTEKLKPGSKNVVVAALDKVRPNLPVTALPKKQTVEKEDKAIRGTKPAGNAKNAAKSKGAAGSKSAPAAAGRKKEEDIDTSPLLSVNNLKHQRTIDETKLKVLKWNFTQPREEFVELLKDQMMTANVNRTLIANMFHSDFRYHIKAIESLNDDLPDNSEALIANLDLILKWLTLRFFDTNPSVLLKGLEYLQSVFNMLIDTRYRMLEYEASSFIPYLVLKIGDPKDTVRNGVKALLNQTNKLYPVNKLFTYIMEGIKSKNARQRAECLDVLGSLIEDFGISVCMPTPGACMKEVAKQISDRDNSVRNAALNCVVQAYYIVGEKVYKLVGNISDKDMSLLEERIKRASKKQHQPKAAEMSTVVPISPQKEVSHNRTIVVEDQDNTLEADEEEAVEEEHLPPMPAIQTRIQDTSREEFQGPYKLDPDYLHQLDNMVTPIPPIPQMKLVDLSFLNDEIKMPTLDEARQQVKEKAKILMEQRKVSSQQTRLSDAMAELELNISKGNSPRKTKSDPVIEQLLRQAVSDNPTTAYMAMTQLQEVLSQPKGLMLAEYEDEFFKALIKQFKNLQHANPTVDSSVCKMYRSLLTVIDSFYFKKVLGKKLSVQTIKSLMDTLITLIVEEKLNSLPGAEDYIKVVNLHCVRVIERSDHTSVMCALIQLITDYIAQDRSPRHVDLVTKCLWRVIKLMPGWEDSVDYDYVLLEVHNFLKKFPSSWWKSKQVDTPLRTIKTILHSSTKIKGGTIMLHLGKIPNTSESEVESYILRLLKSLNITDVAQPAPKVDPPRKVLSRANQNMLTEIFQKIGSTHETKEGLTLLYDFMHHHPEAEVEAYLKKSTKFFQDYVKKGLSEIEESRRKPMEISKFCILCRIIPLWFLKITLNISKPREARNTQRGATSLSTLAVLSF